jgi:hypothetical protein
MKHTNIYKILFIIPLFYACFKPDKTAPEIFLKGNLIYKTPINKPYIEPGYTAIDNRDGDISNLVSVSDTPNTNIARTFFVNYFVSDASGNSSNPSKRIVEVYHDAFSLIDVYSKNSICSNGSFTKENATINRQNGTETDILLGGILQTQANLQGYITGENKRQLIIPQQALGDTSIAGNGIISEDGKTITIKLSLSYNLATDTCNITLERAK